MPGGTKMELLGKLFGERKSSNKSKAVELTNKAFHLVERGEYDSAIETLKQAIKIDSLCGDAYNELAFIYGKIGGDLNLAEEYAWRSVECEPQNPKFYNAINGIQLARVTRLKTRPEIRKSMEQRLQEIQRNIENNPSYPPAYLMKAVALALNGKSKDIWEAELKRAEHLYLESGISGAGLQLMPDQIKNIIARNYNQCLEMSRYWDSVSED